MAKENLFELSSLHGRTGIFADRKEAGGVLADMLDQAQLARSLVLAIPAGGVPVAVPLAEALRAPLDVAVVSKITFPWNSEAGFGAVAFDGSCRLNQPLIRNSELGSAAVEKGIAATRAKVARRVAAFRGERPFPELAGRTVILVDDGLASGFTLLTAVTALRRTGADHLLVAVPTGHAQAVRLLAGEVEALYCANLREGRSFAVADAYRSWEDVSEAEALALLKGHRQPRPKDEPGRN